MLLRYSPCTGGGCQPPLLQGPERYRPCSPSPHQSLGHGFLTLQPPSEYFRHAVKIIQGRGCKVRSATDLAGGGGWQPPPVQGEYLNSTFDFLDDVLFFEKILQGPGALPNRQTLQGPERYRIRNCSSPHGNAWGNFVSWVKQKLQKVLTVLSQLSQVSHKFEGN